MNISIFTEAYGCGSILKACLKSFYKYHDYKVHIYGTEEDFDELEELKQHPNNIFIDLSNDKLMSYMEIRGGHWKTAYIFARHIANNGIQSYIVHFDSDVIFFEECISDIKEQFERGIHLIGPRRCYKYNPCNNDKVRHQRDVISTFFFGINNSKILDINFNSLVNMCRGEENSTSNIPLDFFDPVSYHIIENGGDIFILNNNDYGCNDILGSNKNEFLTANSKMDFGKKIVHFAGVGSGYINTKLNNLNDSYSKWSIERYSLYKKINKELSAEEMSKQIEVMYG